ncbi:hypothetical protein F5Y19DRAFT_440700 [Xylariaceae sp. FL1651]|nr:hypothetical protein F5Y19DRAFT_440700 [Xylariaceae sp. FL1651]
MGAGLDELVESLLTEIAFSGVRGCSVNNLLVAIDSFYKRPEEHVAPAPVDPDSNVKLRHDANKHDLAVASKVWRWLAARLDVSVGINRKFNHMSLEEVLALPEEADPVSSEAAAESLEKPYSADPQGLPRQRPGFHTSKDGASAVRPRLHVSEERQWRTIAGHGPDLKRVPLFEWKALVDIASVKEKGILQGDLVRLTGQDKRSLPTRTEALARKGYIIKQPVSLRGCKSSKLWLAQFAESAEQNQERDGLDYNKVDLSKRKLIKDLEPVPFCDKWNGERLDYVALAQAFMAIVKAWALIRYCDARAKLGVEERVRQMRALAKTSRWLTNIGAVSFVAARFSGSNRLFKDCVKFIRDPSPGEWAQFRSTPKTGMMPPSGRIGKRGAASRAVHTSQQGKPRSKASKKKVDSTGSKANSIPQTSIIPSPWKPQKPIANLTFDIIKRAGSSGTSNAAIGRQTLGHNYRRFTAALTGSISVPTNSQPLHLKHFTSMAQLGRIGKTMTYTFFAHSEIADTTDSENQSQPLEANGEAITQTDIANNTAAGQDNNVFSQPELIQFSRNTNASLTEISQTKQLDGNPLRKRKRRVDEELDNLPSLRGPKRRGRPPISRISSEASVELVDRQPHPDSCNILESQSKIPPDEQEQSESPAHPPLRPPGVYRGLPNSLNPMLKRKGRPRKSLILIFRSDKLKDPSFLELSPGVGNSSHQEGIEILTNRPPIPMDDSGTADASSYAIATSNSIDKSPTIQLRAPQSKNKRPFRCEKCGNGWKNSNGLEYHVTKSRTTCNPDFIAPPQELIPVRKRPVVPPKVPARPSDTRSVPSTQTQTKLTPREQVESRFHREKRSPLPHLEYPSPVKSVPFNEDTTSMQRHEDDPQYRPNRGGIILRDLQVFDVTDHRRILRQQTLRAGREVLTSVKVASPKAPKPSIGHNYSILSTAAFSGPETGPYNSRPDVAAEQVKTTLKDPVPSTMATVSPPVQTNVPSREFSSPSSIEHSTIRRPLPTIPTNKSEDLDPLASTSTTQPSESYTGRTTAEAFGASALRSQLQNGNSPARQHTYRSLDSFARPLRAHASLSARRRNCTIQIIEYLLEQNDGVFPGLGSVFMAVISVWAKEFTDLGPPDRRLCQNIVNQLEREGVLKQIHFFFFDDQAKMQECVVLARTDPKSSVAVDSSGDPRVVAVKEKMREMFPDTYVPDAFSLPQDEAKLFAELTPHGKEYNQIYTSKRQRGTESIQDIETLKYEDSVMGDISISRNNTKRPVDEARLEVQTPTKKARVDVEHLNTHEKIRKSRNRLNQNKIWNSGKSAVYIRNQPQKYGANWNQQLSYLQDPTTGAWSWAPERSTSQAGNVTTILSPVRYPCNIDPSLRRDGHSSWVGFDIHAASDKDDKGSNRKNSNMVIANNDVPLAGEEETLANGERSMDTSGHLMNNGPQAAFSKASTLTSFTAESWESDEDDRNSEDIYEANSEIYNSETSSGGTFEVTFAPVQVLGNSTDVSWSKLSTSFFEDNHSTGFATVGPMPATLWFLKENLPRSLQDIMKTARGINSFKGWADPAYGEFLRKVKTVEKWEQSPDGAQVLTHGTIAPDYIFLSFTPHECKANMKPMSLEWLSANQLTAETMSDEVKNTSLEDEESGLSYRVSGHKGAGNRKPKNGGSKPKATSQKLPRHVKFVKPQKPVPSTQPTEFVEYKTRSLTAIPKQPRGRFNKPAAHDEKLGSKREDELVAACVVFRTLLGGLDRNLDIGLLLKLFPGMSLSAIKKFWPRVSRERKSYIDALTAKFQSAFLEAYENGKLPPLDYDDIESYDWPMLILWATELETHEDVDLPESRQALNQTHMIQDEANEVVDWRETWFATTSTYNRIEAVASETMSIPLPLTSQDKSVLERARTWVRSLCCTSLRGVNVRDKVVPRLLELGNGDATETNQILEKVVAELNSEKVIVRTKGKEFGGNFRIHGNFVKQLEKMACTQKFKQAIVFKAQLDGTFRRETEYSMPYASDDGSIMAALNLQAHGRVRIETVDMPNIPFGFEPGNYEGRTFPKSYYHFKVRLLPTPTYLFDEDMALLKQAKEMKPPIRGPGDKIPIWVDFFGKVNAARWADYVCMVAFTLATKGPLAPKMCATLLKPIVDEFEVQLIIDWLDQLGLMQRAVNGSGITVAEWWWIVAGHIGQENANARLEGQP